MSCSVPLGTLPNKLLNFFNLICYLLVIYLEHECTWDSNQEVKGKSLKKLKIKKMKRRKEIPHGHKQAVVHVYHRVCRSAVVKDN